jgi:Arc/MetJ-type ribon-helix-helix transcriptional regulator
MLTIHLPEDLERYLRDEVQGGRFASPDAAIAEALSLLRQKEEESRRLSRIADEVHRQMLEAGLLSRIPPPIDLDTYEEFTPVPVQGEPVSETIIRERG